MKALFERKDGLRRVMALLLALLLAAGPLAAFAEDPAALPPLVFTVTWGEQTQMASQMTAPGYEDAYWLYLPAEADPSAVWFRVSDTWGQFVSISLADGTVLNAEGMPLSAIAFSDAGTEPGMNAVQGQVYGFDGQATGFRLYISRQTDRPAVSGLPVTPAVLPADVTVVCIEQGGDVLRSDVQTVQPGPFTVTAPVLDGYDLASEGAVSGLVDANGANPARVEFYYTRHVETAQVMVVCIEQGGDVLRSDVQTVQPGPFTISAPVLDGYDLESEGAVSGLVDADGANPARVEFYYTRHVEAAQVMVVCIEQGGDVLRSDVQTVQPGPFTISAPVLDGYDLASEGAVSGMVDANGANPARVEFYYTRHVEAAQVMVVCIEQGGDVLRSDVQTVQPGPFTVTAPVLDGYDRVSEDAVSGLVDANGANPARVEFYYTRHVEAAQVMVVCIEQGGDVLRSDVQTVQPGPFTISAPVLDGYDLASEGAVSGLVDANGANPARVEFYYTRHIEAAQVMVVCIEQGGDVLRSDMQTVQPGPFTVTAPVLDGYDLASEGAFTGTVNADGANPSRVEFYYIRHISPVTVRVSSMDENGTVFAAYERECAPGATVIEAENRQDYDLNPSYPAQVTVEVTADGARPNEVVFHYMAHTVTPVPATETPAPVAFTVPVVYQDTRGQVLAQTEASVNSGENYVTLDTDMVSSVYTAVGESTVRVMVNANGVCEPERVVFSFIAPVDVTVRYLNFDDEEVADAQVVQCVAGPTTIDENPQNLLPGYILADDGRKIITVDENGAHLGGQIIDELVFRYGREVVNPAEPIATPEPRPALVPVSYRTTTGDAPFYVDNTVKCLTGENTVEANSAYVPEGYKAEGPLSVQVYVDENGVATPATVEFLYNVSDMTRDVTVYYRDVNGHDLTEPQKVSVGVGNRTVNADESVIPAGWKLLSEPQQAVRLEENGTLTPDFVIFTLQEISVTPEPKRTVEPVDYPVYDMDAYAYPKADNTPLRSFPSDDESNILAGAGRGELLHIEGYVTNSLQDTWYIVTVGDQTGYMLDTQVRLLSAEDMNALFGTPEPATPTPAPETPIPDGAYIDRWATLNANSVNFRAEASKKSTSLERANRNQKLFVYDSVTVDGEKWYRGSLNGKEGFMMARYVDLMSAADSAAWQATLASPMPERTQAPTPQPATPTPEPSTATPEPTQAMTPTPAPYTGYALVTHVVDLRTGVTLGDTTLATLPINTLVYLYGQAYVNGVCWNSVDAYATGESGYVQDEALRRISAEEAAPYLDALKKTESPALPTMQPDPYTGYARTKGANVMLRNYADEKAEIAAVLGPDEAVWVMGQEYVPGSAYYWDVVQCGKLYGYVRSDQLRMMEPAERAAYEETLRATIAPEVTPVITMPPVTQNSMSSYGYVTTNNVRLRSGAGRNYAQIRMMNQYAFALVLGSEQKEDGLWYYINQAGTVGYVLSDYFQVLSLSQLGEFLSSDQYRSSEAYAKETGGAIVNPGVTGGGITSVEDFNSTVWKNTSMINVTYEPFSNIIASPTPDVEQAATVTPGVTTQITAAPSPSLSPSPSDKPEPTATPEPVAAAGGGSGWLWVGLAAAAAAVGGGAYIYSIYRSNQRRAAKRKLAQRQQSRQQSARPGYQQPTQRVPAQSQGAVYPRQNASSAPQQTSVFTPPSASAPAQSAPRTGASGGNAPGSAANTGASQAPSAPQSSDAAPVRHRRSDRHQG